MLVAQAATALQGDNSSFVGKVFFLQLRKIKRYVPSSPTPEFLVGGPRIKNVSLPCALSFLLSPFQKSELGVPFQVRQGRRLVTRGSFKAVEDYVLWIYTRRLTEFQ